MFTTVWMFAGTTLATRPVKWAHVAGGPVTPDEARTHVRLALGLSAGIAVLTHVVAWTSVVASAFMVPPEEFARVEAIRRGEPVERRLWELNAGSSVETSGGIDFIEMATDGAVAAGRYVGGDMSVWTLALGPWPALAQAWIAPAPERPTHAESWFVAELAFVFSLAFWLPWMTLWTWIGTRGVRNATPTRTSRAGDG